MNSNTPQVATTNTLSASMERQAWVAPQVSVLQAEQTQNAGNNGNGNS